MTGAGRPSLLGHAQPVRSVGGSGAIFTGGAARSFHPPPLALIRAGPATPPLHSLCDRREAAVGDDHSAWRGRDAMRRERKRRFSFCAAPGKSARSADPTPGKRGHPPPPPCGGRLARFNTRGGPAAHCGRDARAPRGIPLRLGVFPGSAGILSTANCTHTTDLKTFFSACPARIPDFLLACIAVTTGSSYDCRRVMVPSGRAGDCWG